MRATPSVPTSTFEAKERNMLAHRHTVLTAALCALLGGAAGFALPARAEDAAKPAKAAAPARASAQQHFASPEAAAAALVAAVKTGDQAAMLGVLGPDAKSIVESGDAVADRQGGERFVASYDAAHALETPNAGRAELVIGEDRWPFPIPIVKEGAGWRFDTAAGQEEVLDRRIGRNERATIQTCLAIVDAQRDYYTRNPDKDPLLHYARRFDSSKGKRDGLYFPTAEGEQESPLGSLVAQARDEGYTKKVGKPTPFTPFHGYVYRMLEAQGPHARDGAYAYVVRGQMIGGFAVVAYPARYDNSGVMTFIVNQDGEVFQKDLGAETGKLVRAIERYDPDQSWQRVPEEDQAPESVSSAE
jgi:Protein of unknown function (DUF2950)